MSEAINIDDKLIKSMNPQPTETVAVAPPIEETPAQEPAVNDVEIDVPVEQKADQEVQDEAPAKELAQDDKKVEVDSSIDEYGNPIEKPKMYSEDEVQRMIRDRLSRGRHAEQQQQTPVHIEARGFTPDPNSEESWEVQLEQFIDRTIDKRQQKLTQQQWQQQESQKQAEFESKFSTGMSKYGDFHQVVQGKPITDSMMLATRSLENPAAFIYGAAKMHPQELQRISQIPDPYVQASEIGRLHEKMVKERKVISQAAKPLEAPKGDLPNKARQQPSIDQRIDQYAKQKRK